MNDLGWNVSRENWVMQNIVDGGPRGGMWPCMFGVTC